MGRMSARKSRQEVNKAAGKRNGGKNRTKIKSGSSRILGKPRINPTPSPPTTRRIGYGTVNLLATTAKPVTKPRNRELVQLGHPRRDLTTLCLCWKVPVVILNP